MTRPKPGPLAYVPFVSVDNMMRLVNATGAERFIAELAGYIEQDFHRWPEFDKTPRVASHSRDGVIELMPTADAENYGFKYVNGHPRNMRDGYQTVTAFGVLSSVANGYPILLTEMTVLTALRTAATSALVGRYLAPKGSQVMAMIGNGAQCEFQALAFRSLCGIGWLRLYDIDARATEKARRNLEPLGFEVVTCRSPEAAVEGAQVVTTCTADKQYATILTDNMVGAGVHLNAIGGDCPGKTELHRDIVLRAGDTLVFQGAPGFVDNHRNSPDFYLVSEVPESAPPRHERARARHGFALVKLFARRLVRVLQQLAIRLAVAELGLGALLDVPREGLRAGVLEEVGACVVAHPVPLPGQRRLRLVAGAVVLLGPSNIGDEVIDFV